MTIAITGGLGHVGRILAECLAHDGFDVRTLDRANGGIDGIAHHRVDILGDAELLRDGLAGCEAVLHFGSIPHPVGKPEGDVFWSNAGGTFRVLEACSELGIEFAVIAGSFNALGYFFGPYSRPLSYLPVDVDHPTHAIDPYSFGKKVVEEVCRYFYYRHGISSIVYRFPMLVDVPEDDSRSEVEIFRNAMRINDLVKRVIEPGSERGSQHARELTRRYNAFRRRHYSKQGHPNDDPEEFGLSRDDIALATQVYNLFSRLHVNELCRLMKMSLETHPNGTHTCFVTEEETGLDVPTEDLASVFYPDALRPRGRLPGTRSLLDTSAVAQLVGFRSRTITDLLRMSRGH